MSFSEIGSTKAKLRERALGSSASRRKTQSWDKALEAGKKKIRRSSMIGFSPFLLSSSSADVSLFQPFGNSKGPGIPQ